MTLETSKSPFDFSNIINRLTLRQSKVKALESSLTAPRVDIKELENHYEITAELPGISQDNIEITVNDGVLAITAKTSPEDASNPEGRLIQQERRNGKLIRSFTLGNTILDKADIETEYSNGLLTLNVPRD